MSLSPSSSVSTGKLPVTPREQTVSSVNQTLLEEIQKISKENLDQLGVIFVRYHVLTSDHCISCTDQREEVIKAIQEYFLAPEEDVLDFDEAASVHEGDDDAFDQAISRDQDEKPLDLVAMIKEVIQAEKPVVTSSSPSQEALTVKSSLQSLKATVIGHSKKIKEIYQVVDAIFDGLCGECKAEKDLSHKHVSESMFI